MDEGKPADIYECLTHVAWEWGMPLRTLVRELERAGYRQYGVPTAKALDEGFAIRRERSGFHWNRERVGGFIEGRIDCERTITPRRCVVVPIVIE